MLAKQYNIPVTVHACEEQNCCDNVREAIEIGIKRIGHGTFILEDPDILDKILKNDITIECCISSNFGWGYISTNLKFNKSQNLLIKWLSKPLLIPLINPPVESIYDHPIKLLYELGVKVTLNSDNSLVTGHRSLEANIQNEIRLCVFELGFSIDQIKRIIRNSLESRFAKIEEDWVQRFFMELDEV